MRPQLLHLSGPFRGRTVTYDDTALEVGSAPAIDLQLADPAVAARHAVIEFKEQDCAFHLRRLDGRVFVNCNEVEEVILQDDDLIEWGEGGPRARFRAYVPPGRVCKPVRRMLADARAVQSASGHIVAAKGLARDLLTVATPQLKVGFPLLLASVLLPLAWLAGWLGSQPSLEARRANEVDRAELRRLRDEQQRQAADLSAVKAANAVMSAVQSQWSRGVCLVHGIAELRWPGRGPVLDDSGGPMQIEYSGSGFLVTADGRVLTNRHVVTPWENASDVWAMCMQQGAQAAFVQLTATFPGRKPVTVPVESIRRRSDLLDVALFVLPVEAVAGVPVLPLHEGPLDNLPDQRAIVVGYPTGLTALLAKADEEMVEDLRRRGADMTLVIDSLAARGFVSPVITQGTVGNVLPTKLVYDAQTTHGGSGGPVFGGDGTVIAVNYAILRDFAGVNFGVPIRFGQELLRP